MKYIENNNWEKTIGKDQIYLAQNNPLYCLPTIKVLVDNDLYFTASIYAWHLPDDHETYKTYFRSMSNVTSFNILHHSMYVLELIESVRMSRICYMLFLRKLQQNVDKKNQKNLRDLQVAFYW